MTLKELREKRFEAGKQIEALRGKHSAERVNEHSGWETAEDRAAFDKAGDEYDAIDAQVRTAETADEEAKRIISRSEQIAKLSSSSTGHVSTDQVRGQVASFFRNQEIAFEGWGRMQYGIEDAVTDEHRAAARAINQGLSPMSEFRWQLSMGNRTWERGGVMSERLWRAITHEQRAAMGMSVDTLGGYSVPEGFVANLEFAMRAFGGIRNVADIMRTPTAAPLPWPTIADTTAGSSDPVYGGALINVGELLGENNPTSLTGTPPQMGSVVFGAQKFSSKLFQISTELLRDSAFNLATTIGQMAGERLVRIMSQKFTWGAGNGIVPRGLLTAVPAAAAAGATGTGYTTASAAGITFDDISNLTFSVDPSYRAGAVFCLHDKIVAGLRLLKDGVGRYLWTAGSVTAGMEPRIWDFPYQVCQEMPYNISGNYLDSTQTNGIGVGTINKIMTFGNHSKFKIREVATIRMKRLVERFAEYDQDGFIAYMEADSDLLDAGTHPVGALAIHS